MTLEADLLYAFEVHSAKGIRKALDAGASATDLIHGKSPVDSLIEMYFRSPQFAECLRVLLDAGATIGDPLLEAVLLDDDVALRKVPDLSRKLHLECAYTSLHGVSALHVCAEYNSVKCARALLDAGISVNVRAEFDADGLGGHTPLFHTVNSNQNHCRPTMELLAEAGADLDIRVKGLVWGGGFDWETILFDVSPISYAQCGLYSQFHRKQEDIYSNIRYLYQKGYGSEPPIRNVPNKYLK